MTTRGNPSISPPVQLSQPRHVPAIAGTPPPNQQLYSHSGQPPPNPQAHYEFLPQQQQTLGQTFLSYQAYGSAPNDLRANSAQGGRGGVPQGNLAPTGHYFQTNQNMRPPQPPQNPGYYVNPQAQRHRQPAAPNQAILMLPHNNNMVISTNMYQPSPRLPTMYPSGASYQPYTNPPGQMMYFANSVQRPQAMPMQPANIPAPRQREKRIISITDPNTGRNITDDVLKNPDLADGGMDDSLSSDRGNEIRKNFTRQVAESLKTGGSPPTQAPVDTNNQSVPPPQLSQQQKHTQPPPPSHYSQQPQQPAPRPHPASHQPPAMPQPQPGSSPAPGGGMVRPPTMMAGGPPPHAPPHLMSQRPGMMQPPAMPPSQQTAGGPPPPNAGQQPRMPINLNLSQPPPHIPNSYYDARNPTQPQQQQPSQPPAALMGQMPPPQAQVMAAAPPQPQQPVMQPQIHSQPQKPVVEQQQCSVPQMKAPAPVQPTVVEAAPVVAQKPVVEPSEPQSQKSVPTSNIPSRPSPEPASETVTETPAVSATAASKLEESVAVAPEPKPTPKAVVKEQSFERMNVTKESEVAPAPEEVAPQSQAPVLSREDSKEGLSFGASTQGNSKDVRKGKKNKKDFSRRDIGGSEMDAFIDAEYKQNGDSNTHSDVKVETESPASSLGKKEGKQADSKETAVNGASSVALKVDVDLEDSTSQENSPLDGINANGSNGDKPSQVDSKSRRKKKKKNKKGTAQAQQAKVCQEEIKMPITTNGAATRGDEERPAANREETNPNIAENVLNGGDIQDMPNTSSFTSYNGNGMDTVVSSERQDSSDGSPTVAQTEPKFNKEIVSSSESSIGNAKEASPPSTTSTEAISVPTVAITPPSAPTMADRQSAKPPTPQKSNFQERPPIQKVAAPEKSSPQKVAVSENTAPQTTVSNAQEEKDNQKPSPEADKRESRSPPKLEERIGNGEPETTSSSEPAITKPSPVKENNQSVNDENEPPKEVGRQKSTEEPTIKDAEAASKQKKDAKADKRQYDRARLMELRECRSSQTKPDGLPDLDIILDRPVSAPRISGNTPLDFTPSFFQATPGGQRHAPPIGKSSSRGRQRPGEMMTPQRIIKSVSIQNDMKPLHQTEKPWKPLSKGDDGEQKRTLEQEVLFIMNRLTPTNFERLAEEMKKLQITTYDNLTEVVKIFFEKATMETKFVQAYAQLCKIMSPYKVPPPPDMKENQATFRVVMLTKCQTEFESDKSVIFESPEDKEKKIKEEMPEDTPERVGKIENELYLMKLRRMRFYGNIRFIGELFKLALLTEKIMHDCIFRLLKARDDDSLLSLCQLLSTVGKELDTEKAKQRMDQYFTQMGKIAEERKSRIKFTLMDVIELRRNHWVPRKETTGPKKLEDVQKDFVQEQARAQYLQSQPLPPRNEPQPGSRRGSRQRQDDKPVMTDDGWNTVGSKNIRMIDASKMKISKPLEADTIQLGPGGGMNRQPMWSRGSHGGAQQSQDDRPSHGSRFSALRNDEDRRPFQRSPSRGDGGPASRGVRQGPTVGHGRGKIMARSSTEGERRDAIASARNILGGGRSQNSSRDNSWNRDERRTFGPRSSGEREDVSRDNISLRPNDFRAPAPPAAKKVPDMSRDEIETKAKNILEEYLNIKDLNEAKLCVQELAGQPMLYLLVSASMNDVLEKADNARFNTGQYLHELLKARLISTDLYLKGLADVLEFAEDMIIDIPKLWTCLAQMIAPILLGGSLTLNQVKSAIVIHLANRSGAILVSNIISIIAEKAGKERAAKEVQGLAWDTFLKEDEVASFLQDRNIDFLSGKGSSIAPSSAISMEQLAGDLENLIRNNASNSELILYIEKSPSVENRDKHIVRALVTAVANSSRSESEKPDRMKEDGIRSRKDVLQKFIGTKIDLQVQALYAIQALMTQLEHPSDVIDMFFNTLYEEEVIDPEAFNKWRSSTEPQEQTGKSVSLLQLKQFFTFLAQEESTEAS